MMIISSNSLTWQAKHGKHPMEKQSQFQKTMDTAIIIVSGFQSWKFGFERELNEQEFTYTIKEMVRSAVILAGQSS
jgi:hypothetical protein